MKTATFPSLRVDPELREAAESVLQDGETLSGFIEASVRETIERRRARAEAFQPVEQRRAAGLQQALVEERLRSREHDAAIDVVLLLTCRLVADTHRAHPAIAAQRAGDPFVAANAARLQAIAWALLVLQLLSLVIGAIAKAVSTPAHPLHLQAGFSINGWLAVLLTFLLARVFAEGTLMREDLEGTV